MTDTPRPGPPARPRRVPLIPGPIETLGLAWRRLRRMSTALALLFALAVASLIATFIPQDPVIGSTVQAWREGTEGPGEAVARVFDALGLFDVFGSWWFAILTGLLFVSLTGCLVPRWRVFARNVRRPAARGQNLTRLSHQVRLPRPAGRDDDQVLDAAGRVFRTYRTRRTTSPGGAAQLAVERGHWRELGSLIFHTSFYLLMIGVVLGAAFSFTGQIDVVEGGSFADTPLGYQSTSEGSLWDTDDHTGHLTTIDDFEVTYLDGENAFTPDEFISRVTFSGGEEGTVSQEIRVNHPAHYNGLTYYQRGFGFAPDITVSSGIDGRELWQDQMILRTDANGLWTGRAKITQGAADAEEPLQIGMEVVFLPDAEFAADGGLRFNSPEPNDPRLVVTLYAAEDLGLGLPVPVSQLEWSQDDVLDTQMVLPGQPASLYGGAFTVAFDDLPMWTGLQVSHQPYRWLLLVAASLTLCGLVPSLYAYRRRLWVEVHDDHVLLAGVALQRKTRFDEEFDDLAERLGTVLRPRPGDPSRSDTTAERPLTRSTP